MLPVPEDTGQTVGTDGVKQGHVDTAKMASATTSNISSLNTPHFFARNVARIGVIGPRLRH